MLPFPITYTITNSLIYISEVTDLVGFFKNEKSVIFISLRHVIAIHWTRERRPRGAGRARRRDTGRRPPPPPRGVVSVQDMLAAEVPAGGRYLFLPVDQTRWRMNVKQWQEKRGTIIEDEEWIKIIEDQESWPFRKHQVALHFLILLQRKIVFYILVLLKCGSARTNHAVPRGIANRSITCTDFDSKRWHICTFIYLIADLLVRYWLH